MLSSKRVWKISRTWGFFTKPNVLATLRGGKFGSATGEPGDYGLSGLSLMNFTTSSALQKQSAVNVSAAP